MDLARGSVLSFVYHAMGTVFVLLVSVVVAHALTDSDRGVYVSVVTGMTAVGAVAGSFAAASGYFVSNRKREPAEVAANSFVLALAIGVPLGAALIVAAVLLEDEARVLLLLVGLGLVPMIARPAIGGVFLGMNALARYNFSLHGASLAGFAVMMIWLYGFGHQTANDALGSFIVGQYVSLALLMTLGMRWWGYMLSHRPSRELIAGMVAFGALTGLTGFISYFNYRIDQLLVLWLAGKTAAGIYPSAVFIAEGLWFLSAAMAMASYASIGGLDRHEAGRLTAQAVRQTTAVVVLAAAVIFVLAPQFLKLLYPDHHVEAAGALRVLCVGTALFAPHTLLSNYYTVQLGKPQLPLAMAALSMAINIGVSILLIPHYGYTGGAWGTMISYAMTTVISVVIFQRISGIGLDEIFRLRIEDVRAYEALLRQLWSRLRSGTPPVEPAESSSRS